VTPMKFSSLFFFAAIAIGACGLTSCETSGSADVKYPTVQQMDDMDVQWGLSRRKPRGTPSRSLVYDQAAGVPSSGGAGGGAVQAPAMPDPVLDSGPRSSITPPSNPAPVIPDQLR
jgi:hypothetical protein